MFSFKSKWFNKNYNAIINISIIGEGLAHQHDEPYCVRTELHLESDPVYLATSALTEGNRIHSQSAADTIVNPDAVDIDLVKSLLLYYYY